MEAVNLGQEDGEVDNLEDDDEANETRSTAESESITRGVATILGKGSKSKWKNFGPEAMPSNETIYVGWIIPDVRSSTLNNYP